MNDYWEIGIHEECPTDATLYLKHPNGEYKIALIEGDFWRCLSGIAQYYDGWSSYIDIYGSYNRYSCIRRQKTSIQCHTS